MRKNRFLINALFILFCINFGNTQSSSSPSLDNIKLKTIIEKGKEFFRKTQRTDGAIRDSLNPLFDTWETILATTALVEKTADTSDITIKKALYFLKNNENPNGLICHNRKCKEGFCMETTALYFSLLIKLGDTSTVQKRCSWICEKQQPNGVWAVGNPDVREQKEYPSVSAFVMAMLQSVDIQAPFREHTFKWLASKQNAEGHWGNAWEYYNCPAYALWACMMAFEKVDTPPQYFDLKKRAVAYILSQQLSDGSWEFKDSSRPKMPCKELQTALMLNTLAYTDYKNNMIAIKKGIDFLCSKQRVDGSWYGGYFPIETVTYNKHEYVFATAMSIIALQKHLDYLNNR